MNLLCLVGGHRAAEEQLWNNGYYFSHCRRCGRDLISRRGRWMRVPSGYRVVWRPRPADYPDWNIVSARAEDESEAVAPAEHHDPSLTEMLRAHN